MTWKPSRPGRNCGLRRSSRPCGLTVDACTNLLMTSAPTSATFCLDDHTTLYVGLASASGAGPVLALCAATAAFHPATAASRRSIAPGIVLFFTPPTSVARPSVFASHDGLIGRSPSPSPPDCPDAAGTPPTMPATISPMANDPASAPLRTRVVSRLFMPLPPQVVSRAASAARPVSTSDDPAWPRYYTKLIQNCRFLSSWVRRC